MKQILVILFIYCLSTATLLAQEEHCLSGQNPILKPDDYLVQIHVREVQYLDIVVHVLYENEAFNISDEQIIEQVQALNDDFSMQNSNFETTPEIFKNIAVDTEVRFCLANKDPDGNGSTGITRTQTNISEIGLSELYFEDLNGGKTAWDHASYINIWVANMGNTGILGFSTFPDQASPPSKDGILINQLFFGVEGVNQPDEHNLGKVLTHEMGHYLGLPHVWGTINTVCDDDDGFSDTPLQAEPTFGCPTFPNPDICTQGDGIMYMNYMDYSDDACLTMFTQEQKDQMWFSLEEYRSGLLDSDNNTCIVSVVAEVANAWTVYPNPATQYVTLEVKTFEFNEPYIVYNAAGTCITSGLIVAENNQIDISTFNSGLYCIQYRNEIKKLVVF